MDSQHTRDWFEKLKANGKNGNGHKPTEEPADPQNEPESQDESPNGELPSLGTLQEELNAATMISQVTEIQAKYNKLLPDDEIDIGIHCDDRRNAIKANRGAGSKA
jgi:hypothetical protein